MTKTFSTRLHLINSFFLKYYILQILPIRIRCKRVLKVLVMFFFLIYCSIL